MTNTTLSERPCPFCGSHEWACWRHLSENGPLYPFESVGGPIANIDLDLYYWRAGRASRGVGPFVDECTECGATIAW